MKTSVRLLALFGLIAMALSASAASASGQTETKKKSGATAPKSKQVKRAKTIDSLANQIASPSSATLSRDIVFDGSSINGRYHAAGEALAVVEQEKNMNELIGFRKDFKDRLAVERNRLKSGRTIGESVSGQGL
jgi:hypothetical protein